MVSSPSKLNNREKVFYVGGFILPNGNAAAHRVLSNAKLFRDNGFEVIFIGITKEPKSSNLIQSQLIQGFKCYEIQYPTNLFEWIIFVTSIKKLKYIIKINGLKSVHSIIAYNFPAIAFLKIILKYKRKGIKILADCTEWYGAKRGNFLFRFIKRFDNNLRIKYAHFKSDGIICISKFFVDYYNNKKTLLLPPLVDINEKKWPQFTPELSDVKTFTYIGSKGSTVEKETFITIISALNKLKNKNSFKLNIVGVTRSELENQTQEINKLLTKMEKNITYWGRLDNSECIELINKSHFFIFIRYNSVVTQAGFPTKFVESISSGTPVITNLTSDLKDFVNLENSVIIDSNELEVVENALNKVFTLDNQSILKMKNHCLNSKLFHYKNYEKDFSKFIESL